MMWGGGNKMVVIYKTCFQHVPVLFHRSEQCSADYAELQSRQNVTIHINYVINMQPSALG